MESVFRQEGLSLDCYRSALIRLFRCALFGALVVLCVRASLLESFYVSSRSMSPTLKPDDFIVVPKLAYGLHLPFIDRPIVSWRSPRRGEVVVVAREDDPHTPYDEAKRVVVKRVVGVSGDRVSVVGALVKVNDQILDESYATWPKGGDRPEEISFLVPPDSVFLMGDNRGESDDSRVWRAPYVPVDRVIGPVAAVYWSRDGLNRAGRLF